VGGVAEPLSGTGVFRDETGQCGRIIVSEADVSVRRMPETWPVMLSAAVLVAVTTAVGLKLDADSASIQPDRYERFLEGARSAD